MTIRGDRPGRPSGGRAFAHASEAEFARILDFYRVPWEYEPQVFPLLWDLEGNVLESFAPDFYLPDMDLYVEMTTLQQRLVRKKNRKVRRLRELYPAVRIKLFYARDFRALMLKYGRFALADELSGTTGQATPPRDHQAQAPALLGEAGASDPQPVRDDIGGTAGWQDSDVPAVSPEPELARQADASAVGETPVAHGSSATRSRRRRAHLAGRAASRDRAAERAATRVPARTPARGPSTPTD